MTESKLVVKAHGKLSCAIHVQPGDKFILSIDGAEVHSRNITESEEVTHWAHFVLPGVGEGYCIGNRNLLKALQHG